MLVAAELADLYRQEREKGRHVVFKAWIDDNPDNLAVVLLATYNATLDDIVNAPRNLSEAVALDFMKLGTGTAEGTKLGIAEDLLRVVSLIPVGRIASAAGGLRPWLGGIIQQIRNNRYWRTLKGKSCVPISIAQALLRTGQRLVIKLEDVAKAMGKDVKAFERAGTKISEQRAALNALKAKFVELPRGAAQSWSDIETFAKGTDGVLLVWLTRVRDGADKFHCVVVSHVEGGVKIFDRYGVFDSLEALSRRYKAVNPSEFYRVSPNHPVFSVLNWAVDPQLVSNLNTAGPLGVIVVRAAMLLGFDPKKPMSQLKAEYEAYVRDHDPGPLPLNPAPGGPPPSNPDYLPFFEVPMEGGFMLSVLSMKMYGTYHMWPLIYDLNREVIGPNPNRVPPGVKLMLLKKERYTAAQIADSRVRSLNWAAYN